MIIKNFDVTLKEKRIVKDDFGFIIEYPNIDYRLEYDFHDLEKFMGDVLAFTWWDRDLHDVPQFKQAKGSSAKYGFYKMALTNLTGMDFNSMNAKYYLE